MFPGDGLHEKCHQKIGIEISPGGERYEIYFDMDHTVLSEIHISIVSAYLQVLSDLFHLLHTGIAEIRIF